MTATAIKAVRQSTRTTTPIITYQAHVPGSSGVEGGSSPANDEDTEAEVVVDSLIELVHEVEALALGLILALALVLVEGLGDPPTDREAEGVAALADELILAERLGEGATLGDMLTEGLRLGLEDWLGWVSLLGHPYSEFIQIL